MKYLKISENKGYFLKKIEESNEWTEIDQITKEDIFELLNKAIEDEFEMDLFLDEKILNKAHNIIYRNLHDKFAELLLSRSRFKDESESLYRQALEKYSINDNEISTS